MIHIENLTKCFGSVAALDGISFDVAAGEVVGLLGPNGAGKTTTMRILTGAMPPTSGVVRVAGRDVARQPLAVKRLVGYLPEVPPLYPEMPVRAYLRFVAELKGMRKSERAAAIDRALTLCWLEDRAEQPIEQLSKGYRQRVGLAQAILHSPDLLVLDEPTSGLDPRQIIEVRQLIRELAGEHTVILSSHILNEIAASCERLVVVHRGKVVATDTVEALTRQFSGGEKIVLQARGDVDAMRRALQAVVGADNVAMVDDTEPGCRRCEVDTSADRDLRAQLAAAIVNGGWELIGMSRTELSLEQVFLRLTEEPDSDDVDEQPRVA